MLSKQKDVPGRRWVRNKDLAEYLGVTVMSLWRWKRNPTLNFPLASDINGIEYNDLDAVEQWIRSRVVNRLAKETAA